MSQPERDLPRQVRQQRHDLDDLYLMTDERFSALDAKVDAGFAEIRGQLAAQNATLRAILDMLHRE